VSFCRETGGTVLISSHLLQELESYADRVVILSRGRVVVEESLEYLRSVATCDVATDDPVRLRNLLDSSSMRWREAADPRVTTVDAEAQTLAQLALDNRVLVTALVPGGGRALERAYLGATSGEYAMGDQVAV
jgi:ABC-2 type transport system ATP-binding protein